MTSLVDDVRTGDTMAVVKKIAGVVGWVGGAMAGLIAVLTACGYVIESCYLGTLGVPRTVFDAKPAEYVLTGGNFFLALPANILVGAISFVVYCLWALLALVAIVLIVRRLRIDRFPAVIAAAVLFTTWMTLILVHLTVAPLTIFPSNTLVMFQLFAFSVALGVAILLAFDVGARRVTTGTYRRARLPLLALIVIACLLLPLLRGTYAIVRHHPILRPLGADAKYLGELRRCASWRLVNMGASAAILSCDGSRGVVVIPSDKLTTFELVPEENAK